MFRIDLNCDLGESYGAFTIGKDTDVLNYLTSANIACGFHAGDYNVMNETIKLAKEKNVAIGAHPGFDDLHGFGRREIKMTPTEIYNLVVYQLGALEAFCRVHHVPMVHVKPHGALYNMAAKNRDIAGAICQAVYHYNPFLLLVGLSGSVLIEEGEKIGLQVINEVFADRTYMSDGTLTPRTRPDAMVKDPTLAIKRVLQMVKEGTIEAIDGTIIPIKADTICIHGDEDAALVFAQTLHKTLLKHGITLSSMERQHDYTNL